MGWLAVPNGLYAVATQARGKATFNSWNEPVPENRSASRPARAMNADLMITIAFCLIVLFGSLAEGVLFALSARNDKAKEAEARRRQELIACKERSSAA